MKKLLVLLSFALFLSTTFTSCHSVSTDAGEEAVLVSKPWIFGSGKIFQEPVEAGKLEWVAASTSAYYYSTLPEKITESFDNIMTADNNPVDLNAHIILQNQTGKTPIIHENFGKSYYKNKIQEEFRSNIRNKVSGFKLFTLTTQRSVVDSLQLVTKEEMKVYIQNLGIPVDVDNVIIGKVIPPDEVLAQTVATAAQKQAERTYEAQTAAEKKREVSEKARAKADQAYAKEMNMSVDQYLKSVELENQRMAIDKKANVSFIYGVQAVHTTK